MPKALLTLLPRLLLVTLPRRMCSAWMRFVVCYEGSSKKSRLTSDEPRATKSTRSSFSSFRFPSQSLIQRLNDATVDRVSPKEVPEATVSPLFAMLMIGWYVVDSQAFVSHRTRSDSFSFFSTAPISLPQVGSSASHPQLELPARSCSERCKRPSVQQS